MFQIVLHMLIVIVRKDNNLYLLHFLKVLLHVIFLNCRQTESWVLGHFPGSNTTHISCKKIDTM